MPNETDFALREDPAFQARVWATQRIAWFVFLAIPLLALTGLFAHGALSRQTAGAARQFSVDYEAYQRVTALTKFVIHAAPAATSDVRLGPSFQQTYEIESIAPQPTRSAAGEDGLHLTFEHSSGPLDAVIWARPRRFGHAGFVAEGGGTAVILNIFVYP
jgi:hypothetical protein